MHSVTRGLEPESLKKNKEKWTKELKEQIEIKGDFAKVDPKYKNRYRQKDVKDALSKMYGECCCYCEGNIKLTSYSHIEHYKPKSKYPELCFEWDNLHQSCSRCNVKKDTNWDEENPILNPTDDKPEEHLFFNGPIISYNKDDKRAENTVNHLDLNREKLIYNRAKLLNHVLKYIDKKDEIKNAVKDTIMTQNSYISFKEYLIRILDGEIVL